MSGVINIATIAMVTTTRAFLSQISSEQMTTESPVSNTAQGKYRQRSISAYLAVHMNQTAFLTTASVLGLILQM